MSKNQDDLFDEDWRSHWIDMPEYVQEEDKEFSKLTVRFDNEDDLMEFAALINQKLTNKTKSIWFPERQKKKRGRWKDESR